MNFERSISALDGERRSSGELSNFGEIVNSPHDDNCGYHSIYFGLQAIGKTDLLKLTEISYLKAINSLESYRKII